MLYLPEDVTGISNTADEALKRWDFKDSLTVIKIIGLKGVRTALTSIVIQESPLFKDRTHPLEGALFSVNMLINTEGGRCYTTDEIKGWPLKFGLKKIKEKFIDDTVLIEGYKEF